MSDRKVLFICIGNSCRSPMAEGLMNALRVPNWRAHSAGVSPGDGISTGARLALAEKGIDMSGHSPRQLSDAILRESDVVVILESTINLGLKDSPKKRVIRWDIPDPYGGPPEGYPRTRDELARRIKQLVRELPA